MARLLVIDDDPQVRAMMGQMLERAGHEVRVAADGDAGLRSLREAPADLAIVDVFMPTRDGLEVIAELRHERPALPVIAISGGLTTRDSARLTRTVLQVAEDSFGAARVLAKPIGWRELVAAVNEVLEAAAIDPTDG
jgi:DNA-binding response OmpR family regulator